MTIRTRNRLNISLFVIANFFLLAEIILLVFSIFTGRFSFPEVTIDNNSTFILTRYFPYAVLASLYIQIIYVSVTSIILYRSFEKTQASDIVYFYLFLIACLADSFRLFIPLLGIAETYSNLLIFCGNATVFAKILMPLSLLCTVILNTVEQRQDIEKNIFILILISIFFAGFIPLNTAVTCPNFAVDYSYKATLKVTTIILLCASVIALYFDNKSHMHRQRTTIGFGLISAGMYILYESTNLLKLVIAFGALIAGNILYLKELHNQYMWND